MNACNSSCVVINILCSLRFCTVWYCSFYFVSLYQYQTRSVLNSSATVRGPIDCFDSDTIQCRVLTRPPKLYVFSRSNVQSMLAAFARDIGIIRSWVEKHTHTHTHIYIYTYIHTYIHTHIHGLCEDSVWNFETFESTQSRILIFLNFSVINRFLMFYTAALYCFNNNLIVAPSLIQN